MKLLKVMDSGLLKKPGDTLFATVTHTGRQVIKVFSGGRKRSAVRYSNGTVVETIVHRRLK